MQALRIATGAVVAPALAGALLVTVPAQSDGGTRLAVRASAAPRTFYPYPDGFRDRTRIKVRINKRSRVDIRITRPSGRTVRRFALGTRPKGTYVRHWNGRRHGRVLAQGRYRVVVTARRGGTTTTDSFRVRLIRKKVVTRSRSYTVAADQWHRYTTKGCGYLRLPGTRGFGPGSVGFYNTCDGLDNVAKAVYRFGGFPAVVMRRGPNLRDAKVRFRVVGGTAVPGASDLGWWGYRYYLENFGDGDGWDWAYDYTAARATTPWSDFDDHYRPGQPFIWSFDTSRDARYDVKHFVLQVRYKRLVRLG